MREVSVFFIVSDSIQFFSSLYVTLCFEVPCPVIHNFSSLSIPVSQSPLNPSPWVFFYQLIRITAQAFPTGKTPKVCNYYSDKITQDSKLHVMLQVAHTPHPGCLTHPSVCAHTLSGFWLQFSCSLLLWLFATPWTAKCQASLSITSSEFTQTHVHGVGDAIQPSHPLSSPSPPALNLSPASGSFQMSQFFASGCQNIGVSASASVLPMNI